MVQFLVGELRSGGPHGMAKIILILIIKHYLHLRAVLVAIVIKLHLPFCYLFSECLLSFLFCFPETAFFGVKYFLAYPFHFSIFAIIYIIHY